MKPKVPRVTIITVVYQQHNGLWDTYVQEYQNIVVKNQHGFMVARHYTEILAQEELGGTVRIGKEIINYHLK